MDATPLYPDGWHPVCTDYTLYMTEPTKPIARYRASPVRYYLRDFRTAVRLPPDQPKRGVGGGWCKTNCPEWSDYMPYDPFKLDVYILGAMYRNFLCKVMCSAPVSKCPVFLRTRWAFAELHESWLPAAGLRTDASLESLPPL